MIHVEFCSLLQELMKRAALKVGNTEPFILGRRYRKHIHSFLCRSKANTQMFFDNVCGVVAFFFTESLNSSW